MTQAPTDDQPPVHGPAHEPWREPWLRELLRCPVDRAELADSKLPGGGAALACTDPAHRVAYPVSDGVPVLLADEAVAVPSGPSAPAGPSDRP